MARPGQPVRAYSQGRVRPIPVYIRELVTGARPISATKWSVGGPAIVASAAMSW